MPSQLDVRTFDMSSLPDGFSSSCLNRPLRETLVAAPTKEEERMKAERAREEAARQRALEQEGERVLNAWRQLPGGDLFDWSAVRAKSALRSHTAALFCLFQGQDSARFLNRGLPPVFARMAGKAVEGLLGAGAPPGQVFLLARAGSLFGFSVVWTHENGWVAHWREVEDLDRSLRGRVVPVHVPEAGRQTLLLRVVKSGV